MPVFSTVSLNELLSESQWNANSPVKAPMYCEIDAMAHLCSYHEKLRDILKYPP